MIALAVIAFVGIIAMLILGVIVWWAWELYEGIKRNGF